jgi:hypothetical protein
MNIVSSTMTPATDAGLKIHGNYQGNETEAGINETSQNGHIPARFFLRNERVIPDSLHIIARG